MINEPQKITSFDSLPSLTVECCGENFSLSVLDKKFKKLRKESNDLKLVLKMLEKEWVFNNGDLPMPNFVKIARTL